VDSAACKRRRTRTSVIVRWVDNNQRQRQRQHRWLSVPWHLAGAHSLGDVMLCGCSCSVGACHGCWGRWVTVVHGGDGW
jgi:hypothetical protein